MVPIIPIVLITSIILSIIENTNLGSVQYNMVKLVDNVDTSVTGLLDAKINEHDL